MVPQAQSIQIFLPDGDPRSLRIAEITSRTVQVLAAPRSQLDALLKRKETKGALAYVLVGHAPGDALPKAYVGETEDLMVHAKKHNQLKDWWDTILLVVSRTSHFTKAHATWLEWHGVVQARAAGRYLLDNATDPTKPFVSEAMEADLHQCFETAKVLFGILGHPAFDSIKHLAPASQVYLNRRGAKAVGEYGAEGLVVRAGSTVAAGTTASAGAWVTKTREALLKDGVLMADKNGLRFAKDYAFKTPSGAADVVSGGSCNGWTEWKYADGRTLDQVHRAK